MRKIVKVIAVIGLVALLSLGTAVAVSAHGGGLFGRSFAPRAGGQEGVAETLGMTVEELQDALRAGKTVADLAKEKGVALQDLKDAADAARDEAVGEAIEQAVTDGDLTRDQADWMLQGLDSGYGVGGRFSAGMFGRFGFRTGAERPGLDAAAEALNNMTADELSLQLWAGESLADVAEAQGVALEDVQGAIEEARQAAMREAIQQAVDNGNMTKEQADWMLHGLEEGYMPRGPEFGRSFGHGMGMMGHGGFHREGYPGGCAPWGEDNESDTGVRFPSSRVSLGHSM